MEVAVQVVALSSIFQDKRVPCNLPMFAEATLSHPQVHSACNLLEHHQQYPSNQKELKYRICQLCLKIQLFVHQQGQKYVFSVGTDQEDIS